MGAEDQSRRAAPGHELVVRRPGRSELELAQAALDKAIAAAEDLAVGAPGTDLVSQRSSDPVTVKRQLAATEQRLHEVQEAVRAATARVEAERQRQLDRAKRVMAPIQAGINRVKAEMVSVDLYLGRDEELHELRDGEPAPADTPVTVRHMVLFMGEEMGAADPEGEFSLVRDIAAFDAWLLADPAHLDQVLPEPKGIVALRPRRKKPERGDSGWGSEEAALNRRTYFLIRNGQRLYRVVTELELDDRLLPYDRERERLFLRETADGRMEPLQPGSYAWDKAAEKAEERDRRYMRAALVVQGLLDRTVIFHPLPDTGLSFLDPYAVLDGRVRFINDAENTVGTGNRRSRSGARSSPSSCSPGCASCSGRGSGSSTTGRPTATRD